MYHKIVVPVALDHPEKLDKALETAADLSKHYGAQTYLIGVTSSAPGSVAHTPEEFAQKLEAFTAAQNAKHGTNFIARPVIIPDPAVELERNLNRQIHELDADLVIMASHVPGFKEYVFHSHAGYLASHTDVSVFVVR